MNPCDEMRTCKTCGVEKNAFLYFSNVRKDCKACYAAKSRNLRRRMGGSYKTAWNRASFGINGAKTI